MVLLIWPLTKQVKQVKPDARNKPCYRSHAPPECYFTSTRATDSVVVSLNTSDSFSGVNGATTKPRAKSVLPSAFSTKP